MTNILLIRVSPRPESHSRRLADRIVARLLERHPGATVVDRDLAAAPPPHPDQALYTAILSRGTALAPDAAAARARAEGYIREIEAADVIVLGTPVNNYTVPSTLKAWIDHVVLIGRSFASTPEGKRGLLKDKPVLVAISSGGYAGAGIDVAPPKQPDFLTPYLRAALGTIGLTSVEFVVLEGTARGPVAVAQGEAAAAAWLDRRLPVPAVA